MDNLASRLALAAASLFVQFHPSELFATLAGIAVLGMVAYWVLRQRRGDASPHAGGVGETAFVAK